MLVTLFLVLISSFSPLPDQYKSLGETVKAKAQKKRSLKNLQRKPKNEPIYPGFHNIENATFNLDYPYLNDHSFDVHGAAVDKALSVVALSTNRQSKISKAVFSGPTFYCDAATQTLYKLTQVLADDGDVFIIKAKEVPPGAVFRNFHKIFDVDSSKATENGCGFMDYSYLTTSPYATLGCQSTVYGNWNEKANEPGVVYSPVNGIDFLAGSQLKISGTITVKLPNLCSWNIIGELKIEFDAGYGFSIQKDIQFEDLEFEKLFKLYGIKGISLGKYKIGASINLNVNLGVKDIILTIPSDIKYLKSYHALLVASFQVAKGSPLEGEIETTFFEREDKNGWGDSDTGESTYKLQLTPTVKLGLRPLVSFGENQIYAEAGLEGKLKTEFTYDPQKCNAPAFGGGAQLIVTSYLFNPKMDFGWFGSVKSNTLTFPVYTSPKIGALCLAGEKFTQEVLTEIEKPLEKKPLILEAKGSVTVTVNGKSHSLEAGQYLFIPSTASYSPTNNNNIEEHETFQLDSKKWTNIKGNKYLSIKMPVVKGKQYLLNCDPKDGSVGFVSIRSLISDGSSVFSEQFIAQKTGVQEIGCVFNNPLNPNVIKDVEVAFGLAYSTNTIFDNKKELTNFNVELEENSQSVSFFVPFDVNQQAIMGIMGDLTTTKTRLGLIIKIKDPNHDLRPTGDAFRLYTEDSGKTDVYFLQIVPGINVEGVTTQQFEQQISFIIPFRRKGNKKTSIEIPIVLWYEISTNYDIFCNHFHEFYTTGHQDIKMGCFHKMEGDDVETEGLYVGLSSSKDISPVAERYLYNKESKLLLNLISFKASNPGSNRHSVALQHYPIIIPEDMYITEITEEESNRLVDIGKQSGVQPIFTVGCKRASTIRVLKIKGETTETVTIQPNTNDGHFPITIEENTAYKVYPICKEKGLLNCDYDFTPEHKYTVFEMSSTIGLENADGHSQNRSSLTAGTTRSLVVGQQSRSVFHKQSVSVNQISIDVTSISSVVQINKKVITAANEENDGWEEVKLYSGSDKKLVIPIDPEKFFEYNEELYKKWTDKDIPTDGILTVMRLNDDANIEIKPGYFDTDKIESISKYLLDQFTNVNDSVNDNDNNNNNGGGDGGDDNKLKIIIPVVVVVVIVIIIIVVVVIVIKKKKADSSSSKHESSS
ncbi:hypothetical protein TRFO_05084 [Tritrichomonas foetus]|uniref:Uncharacterized protein n=1 Tax=Tritrichomonas foetus TaxID=1144522 RepID=A0A1J4KAM3_9EUKA|nr:hypothetical protein TRFO_05084 [Tritrichomonas foetus]|eukprot:OHT07952.1 hypothetical protein TRFO_05084 [Tritrichomonas foetus]